MTACTYCSCDVAAHDPVVVYERDPEAVESDASDEVEGGASDGVDGAASDGVDGSESEAVDGPVSLESEFCNWGCLSAYATESGVATGTTCNWRPEE